MEKYSNKQKEERLSKDRFVTEYMKENPDKTTIEALQEYNRQIAYLRGFTGDISLAKLPTDIKRTIISRTPGARFSILTSKQGKEENRLEIDEKELCTEPISVAEFKKYVLLKTKQFLKNDEPVIIKFVSGYGISIETTESKEEEQLEQKYRGDKRFAVVTGIILDQDSSIMTEKNYNRCSFYSPSYAFTIKRGRIFYSQLTYKNYRNKWIPQIFYGNSVVEKKNLLAKVEKFLIKLNYPDFPNIILGRTIARNIISNRKSCQKFGSEYVYKHAYNKMEIYKQLLEPIPGLLTAKQKLGIIAALSPRHFNIYSFITTDDIGDEDIDKILEEYR